MPGTKQGEGPSPLKTRTLPTCLSESPSPRPAGHARDALVEGQDLFHQTLVQVILVQGWVQVLDRFLQLVFVTQNKGVTHLCSSSLKAV